MNYDTDYDRGDWEHEVKRDKALERIAELEAENGRLWAFAADILSEFWDKMLDGGDIQEIGVKHGMLTREMRNVPCGDACTCAEYLDTGDEAECYRYTPGLIAALAGREE